DFQNLEFTNASGTGAVFLTQVGGTALTVSTSSVSFATTSFTNASGTSITLTSVADLQAVEFTNASGTSLTLTGVADLQGVEFANASGTSLTLTGVADLQGVEFTNASGTSITLTGVGDFQNLEFTNASGTSITLTGTADLQGVEFTNASGTALTLTGAASIGGTLTANTIVPKAAMTIGSFGQTLSLQGSQVNITSTSTSPITFNASTTEVARIDGGSGQILIATTTATTTAKLVLWGGVASETSSISGIYQESRINTSLSGNFQFGNRHIIYVAPTASTSAVGEFIRMIDNTTLKNEVRALEVQGWSGTNVQGVNTGLFAAGRTFGVKAVSNGTAGGVAAPAAVFAEITSATQGQALRLYSSDIASTTQDLAQFYQEISTFEGTGLKMDFARTGGSFTGNFLDLRRGDLTKFSVNATGSVTIAGSSTLVKASSTLIVCGQDQCSLSGASSSSIAWFASADGTTSGFSIIAKGRIASQEADYAEYVPVRGEVSDYGEGDLLSISNSTSSTSTILFEKSRGAYDANLTGAISFRAAFVAGGEDNTEGKVMMALAGRVPVKVTGEGGSILPGDLITAASEPGFGMKATSTGRVVGLALEAFNATTSTSTGNVLVFINPHWYYNSDVEMLQGGTSGDMEINSFTFDESLTTVIQTGTLVANEVYTLSLTVGTSENPGGITLYDVQTKKPYCVLIEYGDLIRYPGTCEENYLVNPAAAPFAEESAPPSTENANSTTATTTEESATITETTTTEEILEPAPEPEPEPQPEPEPEPEPEPSPEPEPAPEPAPEETPSPEEPTS
ncbi:MAG: pentapeptide repeat-containing protein, partial [Candidatus Brennerbacteria bacterium]|nr:pentapeptide repeat-containing protein [Candidatus Brennerbacteria bacterium]